ncbi:hypothetical protein GCM10022243_43550 [Saccharothrix violaceirubra]|uniref:Uncharacterized protein n=1 Tax=Saccharothrix violaceirubra TaxID=413306 RepID=A0A7W7WVS3_9PSEU|nr:hypothetical protein [Saccharothrix violaceirubra]MBB4965644.1 hypothetical protein [Saccharothrix violaceirubra]
MIFVDLAERPHATLHPAALDAALHALALGSDSAARVPFSWRGARLHAPGSHPGGRGCRRPGPAVSR